MEASLLRGALVNVCVTRSGKKGLTGLMATHVDRQGVQSERSIALSRRGPALAHETSPLGRLGTQNSHAPGCTFAWV